MDVDTQYPVSVGFWDRYYDFYECVIRCLGVSKFKLSDFVWPVYDACSIATLTAFYLEWAL